MKAALSPHKPHYKEIFMYGFAIFAMFFGSGNLVFPLQIGQVAGSHWVLGFFGLFLTGIILPFLGLFVIKLHNGNSSAFFKEAGSVAGFILPFFTLSLLGAFGVVPRCITVAYGGVNELFPNLSLFWFSLIFCCLTFILCLKDKFMVKIIGTWMSPILLIALGILIIIGMVKAPALATSASSSMGALSYGFLTGYQTMDLFAAFFFSALVFAQIQNAMSAKISANENNKEDIPVDYKAIIKFAIKPSIIGASLLGIIYLGFVFLGAHYADLISVVAPELMLPTIAQKTMGNSATAFIGIAILFSCLTTAVALNNIYARYLCTLVKVPDNKFPWVLLCTTAISFTVSLLDFRGIAAFLAPALEMSYPGIIALTILSIFIKGRQNLKKYVFYGVTFLMIIYWMIAHL